jgi:hypothetical protein
MVKINLTVQSFWESEDADRIGGSRFDKRAPRFLMSKKPLRRMTKAKTVLGQKEGPTLSATFSSGMAVAT